LQGGSGGAKRFETEHRPHRSLDGSVVLFDDVIQVFDVPHFDLLTGFLLERLDGRGIGAALVDRDLFRQTVLPDRFLEKNPERLSYRDGLSAGSRWCARACRRRASGVSPGP
jgi:hypothetical protein